MIKLVVFDMAGTTVNEHNVVYKTLLSAINAAGYSFTQQQVLSNGAGKEKSEAIRDVLALDGAEHPNAEVAVIFSDFQSRLRQAYADLEVTEQLGASDTFKQLRSREIKVVLNTGYDRPTALRLLQKIGWEIGTDVDALVTASDVENSRPAPDMIHRAMLICGVDDASHVAKVGDSQIDIQEGQNAHCGMTFGITTGAQSASELQESRPTSVVSHLSELIGFIDQRSQKSD